jgi:phospholipase D1/2
MVRDVSSNFIERWNHHTKDRSSITFSSKAFSNEAYFENTSFDKRKSSDVLNHFDKGGFKCTCQVLRSITDWSGSSNNLEQSIYTAMVDLISKAKYYIYIEQQFFISSTSGGGVSNTIAEVILQKIRTAIIQNEVFRVFVILPNHPEGLIQDSSIQQVLKWQYKTINRGKTSLISQLESEFPSVDLSNYIIFNTLRNYDFILDKPVTEFIYVHSKLMIVDDLYVLTGSANINDRSLLGSRDSEMSLVIEDEEYLKSEMNGESFNAGKFAISLRRRLWKEHLGITSDSLIKDPICKETWEGLWKKTSNANSKIFLKIFPWIPSNEIQTLDVYVKLNKEKELGSDNIKEIKRILSKIKGHLCDFPLDFLLKEAFNVPIERKVLLTDSVYQ